MDLHEIMFNLELDPYAGFPAFLTEHGTFPQDARLLYLQDFPFGA